MIDDGWNEAYGTWEFSVGAFPDPKAMVDELHRMGFGVMLWICPFISPDTRVSRELADKGLLIRDRSGEVAIKKWWNGYSAVLDLSHPQAIAWMRAQLDSLMAVSYTHLDVYQRQDNKPALAGVSRAAARRAEGK